MIDEPRVAFMYHSSIILGLSDSGLFRGLLITILRSQSDSMVVDPKVWLRVGRQDSQFGPILARFLDYYSLFWVPE